MASPFKIHRILLILLILTLTLTQGQLNAECCYEDWEKLIKKVQDAVQKYSSDPSNPELKKIFSEWKKPSTDYLVEKPIGICLGRLEYKCVNETKRCECNKIKLFNYVPEGRDCVAAEATTGVKNFCHRANRIPTKCKAGDKCGIVDTERQFGFCEFDPDAPPLPEDYDDPEPDFIETYYEKNLTVISDALYLKVIECYDTLYIHYGGSCDDAELDRLSRKRGEKDFHGRSSTEEDDRELEELTKATCRQPSTCMNGKCACSTLSFAPKCDGEPTTVQNKQKTCVKESQAYEKVFQINMAARKNLERFKIAREEYIYCMENHKIPYNAKCREIEKKAYIANLAARGFKRQMNYAGKIPLPHQIALSGLYCPENAPCQNNVCLCQGSNCFDFVQDRGDDCMTEWMDMIGARNNITNPPQEVRSGSMTFVNGQIWSLVVLTVGVVVVTKWKTLFFEI